MYYPTGKTKGDRDLMCMKECYSQVNEKLGSCNEECVMECLDKWLNEENLCVSCNQLNEYLNECGYSLQVNEDGGMAAPAPAPGLATVATVPGMGNPATPQNGGTNAGFYNPSLSGSGDKFTSLTAGTAAAKKRKKSLVKKFRDFVKLKESNQL
jgi:hypothetical protein